MRITVINPNTTPSMTETIRAAAEGAAAPGTEIVAVSPSMGPASIGGHYDEAMSALGVPEEVRRGEALGCHGYVLARFGDAGPAWNHPRRAPLNLRAPAAGPGAARV